MEKVCLTRAFNFSAGHRLFIEGLSEEENIKIFDKCANPRGHGHDYRVEIMVTGEISKETGMIIDRKNIDEGMREIVNDFDYKRIDLEIPYFKKNLSTVENITLYIWDKLYKKYESQLAYVKVWENERSFFEYYEEALR
jgi:6-pyruvoyltetrahydropterin/6-carboxytetrahydropterin synthase